MILSSAIYVPLRRPPLRTVCMATNINTEQLRSQLDQLLAEAEKARSKANNARFRLMRLSETAEKLQRQAVISVQVGKENEARELLVQKRKVMQALEKSKSRIELLDELSTKLNEAISAKETQLIGNVALDLEVGSEDNSRPIRIISPKDVPDNSNENKDLNPITMESKEYQEQTYQKEHLKNLPLSHQQEGIEEEAASKGIWDVDDTISSLKGVFNYEDFLEHLDKQLTKIEVELITVLRLSTLVLEGEEKPKNSKVKQTIEILENVQSIRRRISNIMQMKAEIR